MAKHLTQTIFIFLLFLIVSPLSAKNNVTYYYNLNLPGDPGCKPGYYDYCRYHKPHWEGRRFVCARRVCYSEGYGYCWWVPPHWEGGYLITAHRVCW